MIAAATVAAVAVVAEAVAVAAVAVFGSSSLLSGLKSKPLADGALIAHVKVRAVQAVGLRA